MALQRNVRPNRVAAQASRGHFVVMGAGQIRQKTGAAARPALIPGVFLAVFLLQPQQQALVFCFNAFSSREPVPTSLENAFSA
jgi:hypothetical protein